MSHEPSGYECTFRPRITRRYWKANVTAWKCADDHLSGSPLRESERPLAVDAATETRRS
jgi:hypothetical protein